MEKNNSKLCKDFPLSHARTELQFKTLRSGKVFLMSKKRKKKKGQI
jgi:hypothetical protein